jgi:predicted O-linked N-acetylglucosamine transferase (SPINDLY family)
MLLLSLRHKLAGNRKTHLLFDTDRFARHLEAAYATMWQRAQRGDPAESFAVAALP